MGNVTIINYRKLISIKITHMVSYIKYSFTSFIYYSDMPETGSRKKVKASIGEGAH